jgi:hypothetical protein
MNMQTIQIMILLFDGFIKLAPWRTVTETMDRIGYAASESLARSISVALAACAGLCPLPTASIFGPLLLTGYFTGVVLCPAAGCCSAISCSGFMSVWRCGPVCGGAAGAHASIRRRNFRYFALMMKRKVHA